MRLADEYAPRASTFNGTINWVELEAGIQSGHCPTRAGGGGASSDDALHASPGAGGATSSAQQ